MIRNIIQVYPDGDALVFHKPFSATSTRIRLLDKGAAVLEREGVLHVFTDLKLVDHFRIADDEGSAYSARYAGEVRA